MTVYPSTLTADEGDTDPVALPPAPNGYFLYKKSGQWYSKDSAGAVTPIFGADASTLMIAGAGLSGGGDLSADRTFDVNVDGVGIEIATDALQLKDKGVAYAKMPDQAAATFLMRALSAGTGPPIAGTAAQAKTALAIAEADVTNLVSDLAAKQALDATLTALAAANWAANALPIGTGADTLAQTTFAANTFPARASTGNLVAKTIHDDGLTLVSGDKAAATAFLNAATTSLQGMQSAVDKTNWNKFFGFTGSTTQKMIYPVEMFGAVGDGDGVGGGTNDTTAITNTIAAAAANRGGIVAFGPRVYNINAELGVSTGGVVLRGGAMQGMTDASGVSQTAVGSTLFWIGVGSPATTSMIRVGVVSGADPVANTTPAVKGCEVSGLNLQCAGNVGIGLLIKSVQFCTFTNLYIINPTSKAIETQCFQTSGSSPRDAMDTSGCLFQTISIRCIDGGANAASGIVIGGSSNANTSNCDFINVKISYDGSGGAATGIALDVVNADSNRFRGVIINKSTAANFAQPGVYLRGNASAGQQCRANAFYFLSAGASGLKIDDVSANPATDNFCWGYSTENGEGLPFLQSGGTLTGDIAVEHLFKYVATGAASSGLGQSSASMLGNFPSRAMTAAVTCNTTAGVDTTLRFKIAPNEKIAFEAYLQINNSITTTTTSFGAKFAIAGPATCTVAASVFGNVNASTAFVTNRIVALSTFTPTGLGASMTSSATSGMVQVVGTVNNTGTASGNVILRVSTATTTAQVVTVQPGSSIRAFLAQDV